MAGVRGVSWCDADVLSWILGIAGGATEVDGRGAGDNAANVGAGIGVGSEGLTLNLSLGPGVGCIGSGCVTVSIGGITPIFL
jgi:hypothetical protein